MDSLTDQWFVGLGDGRHIARVFARLLVALLLGGILGYERQKVGKAAGLRTHMLVTMGAALFILVPLEAGVKLDQLMRVAQGVAAGIGFLGAGAILKMPEQRIIHGLTTAGNIWLAAAAGMAVGLGILWPAVIAVALGTAILYVLRWLEPWIDSRNPKES